MKNKNFKKIRTFITITFFVIASLFISSCSSPWDCDVYTPIGEWKLTSAVKKVYHVYEYKNEDEIIKMLTFEESNHIKAFQPVLLRSDSLVIMDNWNLQKDILIIDQDTMFSNIITFPYPVIEILAMTSDYLTKRIYEIKKLDNNYMVIRTSGQYLELDDITVEYFYVELFFEKK